MSSGGGDTHREGIVARQTARVRRARERAFAWLEERRAFSVPVDVAARIYERDRANFGSVLGSALAFRLFLFIVSLVTLAVGIGTFIVDVGIANGSVGDDLGLTSTLAADVDRSLAGSQPKAWLFIGAGLIGAVWTGKNLASTLVAVSSRSWELTRSGSAMTVRVVTLVVGLNAALLFSSALLETIRDNSGLAVATTSLVIVFLVYGTGWFFVTLVLPRATTDPGAMLPGAVLVGATMMGMQAVSQIYLAPRLDADNQLLGNVGVTAVVMGWLFFASRMMVASLSVNAVIYEEIGSVSHLMLVIPGVRWVPKRFPSVARYFDLEWEPAERKS